MTFQLTVLQPRTVQCPASLLIRLDKQCILINCPGGTQRIMNAYGLGMVNITYIVITRLCPETMEGLLGVLLTRVQSKLEPITIIYNNSAHRGETLFQHMNDFQHDQIFKGQIIQLTKKQHCVIYDTQFELELMQDEDDVSMGIRPLIMHEKVDIAKVDALGLDRRLISQLRKEGRLECGGRNICYSDISIMAPYPQLSLNQTSIVVDNFRGMPLHVPLTIEPNNANYPINGFVELYYVQTGIMLPSNPNTVGLNVYVLFPPTQQRVYNIQEQEHVKRSERANDATHSQIVQFNQVACHAKHSRFTLLMLGTGCAIPGKYNSVQAQLLHDHATNEFLLFDAGEATFQQLCFVGSPQLQDMRLLYILITHEHADHYLGLPTLINQYYSIFGRLPGLVCPLPVFSYLQLTLPEALAKRYQKTEGELIHDQYIINIPPGERLTHQLTIGAAQVTAIRSFHTPHSTAYLLQYDGHKIAFSGDLRPLHLQAHWPQLQNLFSKNAEDEILAIVHECTYMENEQAEAIRHDHSVLCEVLEFRKVVGANLLFLTHFSQRYSKKRIVDDDMERMGIKQCYDYFTYHF